MDFYIGSGIIIVSDKKGDYMRVNSCKNSVSYLQYYESNIAPKFKEIDIHFRTKKIMPVLKAACLLDMSEKEVEKMIDNYKISKLDKHAFFKIMLSGSSEICTLFKHEVECGMPEKYSIEDFSYIFRLSIEDVVTAFLKTGLREVSHDHLSKIFSYIPYDSSTHYVN